MKSEVEIAAAEFFEVASEQRLAILSELSESNTTVSKIAKKLNATVPEVFRNVSRLSKAGFIKKDSDGSYALTPRGKIICMHIPSFVFSAKNESFLSDHSLGNIPPKFLQRIGALQDGKHIKGYVKVMEKWKEIYENSQKHILNILTEIPYTEDITRPLTKKLKDGIKVRTIFSDKTIVPKERKKIVESVFKEFVENGNISRKMLKDVSVVLVMNEKEAGIIFPKDGEPDMSRMIFGDKPEFHDWCQDYFEYCWSNSSSFQESKLVLD